MCTIHVDAAAIYNAHLFDQTISFESLDRRALPAGRSTSCRRKRAVVTADAAAAAMAVDVCITAPVDVDLVPWTSSYRRRHCVVLVHAARLASCHRAAFGGHRLRRQVCGKNVGHLPPLTSAPDLTLTQNHNA